MSKTQRYSKAEMSDRHLARQKRTKLRRRTIMCRKKARSKRTIKPMFLQPETFGERRKMRESVSEKRRAEDRAARRELKKFGRTARRFHADGSFWELFELCYA